MPLPPCCLVQPDWNPARFVRSRDLGPGAREVVLEVEIRWGVHGCGAEVVPFLWPRACLSADASPLLPSLGGGVHAFLVVGPGAGDEGDGAGVGGGGGKQEGLGGPGGLRWWGSS